MATQYLGIEIIQYRNPSYFSLYQYRYIEAMLYQFHMENLNNVHTPAIDCNSINKYHKDPKKIPYIDHVPMEDIKFFKHVIECLLYLVNTTCYDIAYTVNRLAQQSYNL